MSSLASSPIEQLALMGLAHKSNNKDSMAIPKVAVDPESLKKDQGLISKHNHNGNTRQNSHYFNQTGAP